MSSNNSDNSDNSNKTSSSEKSSPIDKNKKINFSTDYNVGLLQDSQKLLPKDKRTVYSKNIEPIKEEELDDEESEKSNMEKYLQKNNSNMEEEQIKKHAVFGTSNKIDNETNNKTYEQSATNKVFSKFVGTDDYDTLSPDAQLIKRLNLMKKLGELARSRNITLSQKYNINSDYYMMKYEFNLHNDIVHKQEFTNMATSVMRYCIYGIENLNEKYNTYFDLRLKGWSDNVGSNIESFTDVWGEIYEKYNQPGRYSEPEYRLIFLLACGGIGYHMNNDGSQQNRQHQNNMLNKQKMSEQHNGVESQMKTMKEINEQYAKNEELRMKNEQLQKEREEFERFKQMQEKNKQIQLMQQQQQMQQQQMQQQMYQQQMQQENNRQTLLNSQNYQNTYPDERNENIQKQLNQIKNSVKQNVIPSYDPRNDINIMDKKQSKTKINVDTSDTSKSTSTSTIENIKNKSDKKSNVSTGLSTFSKKNGKKGITINTK
jgi:hypothetical protein